MAAQAGRQVTQHIRQGCLNQPGLLGDQGREVRKGGGTIHTAGLSWRVEYCHLLPARRTGTRNAMGSLGNRWPHSASCSTHVSPLCNAGPASPRQPPLLL